MADTGKTDSRTDKKTGNKTGNKTDNKNGSRKQAIGDLDRLMVALDELAAQLVFVRGQYAKAKQSLEEGDTVETALDKARAAETRESIMVALDEFEKCRYVSRISLVAAGLDDGMSINALGKSWGVSRQLISRYVGLIRKEEVEGQAHGEQ
jgi:hypothetical protein